MTGYGSHRETGWDRKDKIPRLRIADRDRLGLGKRIEQLVEVIDHDQ